MEQIITIFTDGACRGNPGKGGIGVVLISGKHRKEISVGYKLTTNNRMELRAVIEALKNLKKKCNVKLHSDSEYVTKAINYGWLSKWEKTNWQNSKKEPVKNIDLWKEIIEMINIHTVEFVWVKAHDTNTENNRADELARMGINLPNLLIDLSNGV